MLPVALLGAITGVIGDVLSKIVPDVNQRAQAAKEITDQIAGLDLEVLKGQQRLNEQEANSPSLFIAGPRPAALWLCVFGLAYSLILNPFLTWFALIYHFPAPPNLDNETLMTLTTGLLGLAGIRGWEKVKGVARENLR